jgi:hypothetical protein
MNTETRWVEFNNTSTDAVNASSSSLLTATESTLCVNDANYITEAAPKEIDQSTSGSLSLPNQQLLDSDYREVPVVGLPGPVFTILHSSALCSISTSIVVSVLLLIFLCACRRKQKPRKQQLDNEETLQQTISRIGDAEDSFVESPATASKVDISVSKGGDNYGRIAHKNAGR